MPARPAGGVLKAEWLGQHRAPAEVDDGPRLRSSANRAWSTARTLWTEPAQLKKPRDQDAGHDQANREDPQGTKWSKTMGRSTGRRSILSRRVLKARGHFGTQQYAFPRFCYAARFAGTVRIAIEAHAADRITWSHKWL